MPEPVVVKVSTVCGMSFETVEKRWKGAIKAAGDKKDDMKYVMSIFKHSLGKECIDKLVKKEGWKPIEWKSESLEGLSSIMDEIMYDSLYNKPEGCI